MDVADSSLITHFHTAPRATQKALAYMSAQRWLKRSAWYLAGGTALALQTGHRQSVDLDFFTPRKDFSPFCPRKALCMVWLYTHAGFL